MLVGLFSATRFELRKKEDKRIGHQKRGIQICGGRNMEGMEIQEPVRMSSELQQLVDIFSKRLYSVDFVDN